jgi:hypothetical protein
MVDESTALFLILLNLIFSTNYASCNATIAKFPFSRVGICNGIVVPLWN